MKTNHIGNFFRVVTLVVGLTVAFNEEASCSQDGKKGWEQPPRQSLTGQIEIPANMSKVSRTFLVAGTISGPTRHLWLVERIGNQHWPKEPELHPSNGSWQGEIFEGGQPPDGTFEILLVEVSAEVSGKFVDWLQTGHRTGSYPGIPALELGASTIVDAKMYSLSEK